MNTEQDNLTETNNNYLDAVAFVAHEFKGVLSSLVVNIYNLQQGLLGPVNASQQAVLRSVSQNLDYLNTTAVNFLSLSRIEKCEIVLNSAPLVLKKDIIDVSLKVFSCLAREREIKIVLDVSDDLTLRADRDLLVIVFNNLISNAVKYGAPKGELRITAVKSEDRVSLEIYNDGNPVSILDTDKLFKKFSRLDYDGTQIGKGTGIGLFIAKKIIEQHGGMIRVEPRAQGNAFIFSLNIES